MPEKKLSFEQAIGRLEEIVAQMEGGERPLDESLALFEEGTKLVKQCGAILDKAEQKVVKLTSDENGVLTEQPFLPKE